MVATTISSLKNPPTNLTGTHTSSIGNFYLFTGRRLDILDNSSLKIQYNRNRYYDYYTGRFTTHDPLGINPAGGRENPFWILWQYNDGSNLYEYVSSNPLMQWDSFGLWGSGMHYGMTKEVAEAIGYNNDCAEKIARACDYVDSIMSGRSPLPWIGDQTYHFDVPTGARTAKFNKHRSKAHTAAGANRVNKALNEMGTALHPFQDAWSHNTGHYSATPKEHAPWYHCVLLGGFIFDRAWCLAAENTHPNWSDHTRPDQAVA